MPPHLFSPLSLTHTYTCRYLLYVWQVAELEATVERLTTAAVEGEQRGQGRLLALKKQLEDTHTALAAERTERMLEQQVRAA